ncbi:MAG: SufE family protein [Alphaproteobacteria bacterium]
MEYLDKINNLIEDFSFFDTWEEKYEYIIDMGKKLPPMDDALKTDETKVKGCMSQVWLVGFNDGDKITFVADSDAIIVKGLIGLLMKIFNGATKQEINNTDINDLFAKLGLDKNLAGTRRNGLASMVNKIKEYASH